MSDPFLITGPAVQWWDEVEASARGRTRQKEIGNFRGDREDYATMLQIVRDQGTLPFDLDEPSLPCDMAACGV